ncbi:MULTISPECIES: peroxiredoxin [unclassified Novosphingobium]|uniref:peroxiredoxin n=2 Tax=Novosphingobium TaxID=165696 RepID=UPI000D2F94E1|nr:MULTISPECIES: peroxiredoxin [unclassified Novosphingobium]PTR12752.1 peroxiredoxin [Novosphingobium sp. GV055]PUB06536.1 peroxiredoxin [Novosphingobium sp. GV061]PUB22587.1 peroxiredoxin [Novosphingobium sp. GV079]PUB44612.1 peroxiredoxin [Novosphingobium sp. GV027]
MNTRSPLAALAAFALSLTPMAAAHAALPQGARAPDFSAQGALGGKPFSFNLKKALKRGPVVLYFYPKAFTQGCTMEAHAFADATADFARAGATVIGMSNDDIATLTRFSTEECRDKFAVAVASPAVVRAYDVDLQQGGKSTGLTTRTSYVIAPDGRITLVHSDMDYRDHVRLTLAAVQAMHRRHG